MTGFRLGCGGKKAPTDKLSPPGKPSALVDAVTAPNQGFGIKSYLHHFYQSPTVEDVEQSAWYLLPPPPSTRRGLFFCRICTCLGLMLLLSGAACIVVGYTWPHEGVEDKMDRIALDMEYTDGNWYIPRSKFLELTRDPLKTWKTIGFCVFSVGAMMLALSLLVPTFALAVGSKHLASFASEDNSPNEPPVRIYPGAPGYTSCPVPVSEAMSTVQPGESSSPLPTTDELLAH